MNIPLSPMMASDLETVLALWARTDGVGLNESDTPDRLRAFRIESPALSSERPATSMARASSSWVSMWCGRGVG